MKNHDYNIRQTIVRITPEMAQQWLENNHNNRKISRDLVRSYAAIMMRGEWTLSDSPIAITSGGEIRNGQHRLLAIVKSGCSVKTNVLYNCPQNMVFDCGRKRTVGEELYFCGKIDKKYTGTNESALANAWYVMTGTNKNEITPNMIAEFYYRFGSGLADDVIHMSQNGARGKVALTKAYVRAAMLAALVMGESKEELIRFCNAANSGFMDRPQDSCAIVLRNYLLSMSGVSSISRNREICAATEAAVHAYMNGETRRNAFKTDNHYYFDKINTRK